jgi:hypothetical protein
MTSRFELVKIHSRFHSIYFRLIQVDDVIEDSTDILSASNSSIPKCVQVAEAGCDFCCLKCPSLTSGVGLEIEDLVFQQRDQRSELPRNTS